MQVHQLLLTRLDLEAMEGLTDARLREELRTMVERLLTEENVVVNAPERRDLVRDIQHEMLGLGPARAAAGRPDHLRHPGQRLAAGVRRAARSAGA